MVTIIQKGDSVLAKKAKSVPKSLFGSKELALIIKNMREALDSQHDGIAIAAPQIGVPYRLFVVSEKAYRPSIKNKQLVFINPEITKRSKDKKPLLEGCLSVRWYYGDVMRHTKATIKAFDEHGQEFERGGSGLLAQIFQHETDHLEGILFDSKAKNLHVFEPPHNNA
jgi:peptide deformylase